ATVDFTLGQFDDCADKRVTAERSVRGNRGAGRNQTTIKFGRTVGTNKRSQSAKDLFLLRVKSNLVEFAGEFVQSAKTVIDSSLKRPVGLQTLLGDSATLRVLT